MISGNSCHVVYKGNTVRITDWLWTRIAHYFRGWLTTFRKGESVWEFHLLMLHTISTLTIKSYLGCNDASVWMRYSTIWFHALNSATNPAKQRIPLHISGSEPWVENPHAIVGSILSWQGKDNIVFPIPKWHHSLLWSYYWFWWAIINQNEVISRPWYFANSIDTWFLPKSKLMTVLNLEGNYFIGRNNKEVWRANLILLPSIVQVQTLIKQANIVELKLLTGELLIGKIGWIKTASVFNENL